MCTIDKRKRTKLTKGYKVLVERSGKFFSTFTSQLIDVGPVSKFPNKPQRLCVYWTSSVDKGSFKQHTSYRDNFNGCTAVFVNKHDAELLVQSMRNIDETVTKRHDIVICRIEFDGKVYPGDYGGDDIIAGSVIKSIKKVKSY